MGVTLSAGGTVSCIPHTYTQDVTHTSIVSVTSLINSFRPFGGGSQDVTFTQTNTVWTTTTTTLDQKDHPPPVVLTSTTRLVSTAHVTVTHTVQVPSTSTITTTVLRTTLEVTTMAITHSASLPFPPRHTHTAPATPPITMTQPPPPPAPTLTLISWVTSHITVTPSLPPPEVVTTTQSSTVTFCDAPHTTILTPVVN